MPCYTLDYAALEFTWRRDVLDPGDDLWRVAYGPGAVNADVARRQWLASMGGRQTQAATALRFEHVVQWIGAGTLHRLVRNARRSTLYHFSAMVRELHRCRLLTAEDAARLEPDLHLVLRDLRGNQRVALPTPAELLPEFVR